MYFNQSNKLDNFELPLQLKVSFKKVVDYYKKYASEKDHPYKKFSKKILEELKQFPAMTEGFDDYSLLDTHHDFIDKLLDPLFPMPLENNEIKAATVPFSFISFKLSKRFQNILKNADQDYDFSIRNMDQDELYVNACVLILNFCYGYNIDFKRPYFFDIPDINTGITKHYRVALNGDFMEIIPTKNAPSITEKDYKLLLDNFDNIDTWKEKFPPNSYIFKGFGLMNLFDVTAEETLSSLKANLLREDDNLMADLQLNLRELFNIEDLKLGYSIFDGINSKICETSIKKTDSLILNSQTEIHCDHYFCEGIMQRVFVDHEAFPISDLEKYGRNTNKNPFYKNLHNQGIQSILLIPIKATENNDLALLEIASPRPYELNSVSLNKLKDIIPVFEAAVKRSSEELKNIIQATIQEHYTSIHSAVKWRFYEAAEKYYEDQNNGLENIKLNDIVFDKVYPLYGQLDIKGSSLARNVAIKKDLVFQLTLAIDVLIKACKVEKLPIYKELRFRVESFLNDVKDGLNAGDEIGILDFLKREIYPVFNHAQKLDSNIEKAVKIYMKNLDPELHVVYDHRKAYENSVTLLNERMSEYLDKKQDEAQKMFPHYFERYKTDGVEFNMYIGQSLVKNKDFDLIYLYNLRLWQLQTMCEMENLAFQLKPELENKLEISSLILVHSNAMAIKFRMDEKQFDVDGAYNIRYEILKKRIDKAYVKNTDDRLTVPGKIAIVYSQDKDAEEYRKYINYLQSKNILGPVENLDIEDLLGVSGLKALRAEIIYSKTFDQRTTITIDELIEDINA